MNKGLRLCALVLLGVAANSVAALAAPLHSDPAPDDNLRLYMLLSSPSMTSSLDGLDPSPAESMAVMFSRLSPGAHTWALTLADGTAASIDFALSTDGMIESKGRRWWCLMAGRREGRLTLLQMPSAQCRQMTDSGPD